MSRRRAIVERLLSGDEYDETRIDDEIAAWHEADTTLKLHEWLGFTHDEFALYVEKPESLRAILAARHYRVPIADFLFANSASTLLAARGSTPEEVAQLREWLKRTQRL